MAELNEVRVRHELNFKGTYELIYPCKNDAKMSKYKEFVQGAVKLLNYNMNTSLPAGTIPTVSDIRSKLKENPKAKIVSKQLIKENVSRNRTEVSASKKNLIYSYNYGKKDNSSKKRTLLTLPAEPHRVEVQPQGEVHQQ